MIDKQIKTTFRLSETNSNALKYTAKKNHITVNKLVNEIISYHMSDLEKINNKDNINQIMNKLEQLEKSLIDLQKNNIFQKELLKQLFINSGFPKNRDSKEDKVYQEFIKQKYEKNTENHI